MSDIAIDISKMNQVLSDFDEPTEPEQEVEEPVEEAEGEEEEEVVADESDEEEPVEEPEPEPDPEPVIDERDQVIADLKARLEKLEKPKPEPTEPEPKPQREPEVETRTFIDEEVDMYELTNDREKFNKLLNDIYKQAVIDTQKRLGEGVLKTIPDIVRSNVTLMTNLKQASEEFYNDNPDLKGFKKVVATVFEELSSENPDKNYRELMKETGIEARKRLGLGKETKPKLKKGAPRLPKTKTQSRPSEKPSTNPLQAELEEMNKVLGGN